MTLSSHGRGQGGNGHAFGQKLARQPAAGRAQCAAHCDFVPPRRRPHQLQVCDVGARNQQHKSDCGQQHQRRRSRISRQMPLQGRQFHRDAAHVIHQHRRVIAEARLLPTLYLVSGGAHRNVISQPGQRMHDQEAVLHVEAGGNGKRR